MSTSLPGFEREIPEAFDWHHQELIANMPYTQDNMVHALVAGQFIIEGKQSGIEDAILFADTLSEMRKDKRCLWDAMGRYAVVEMEPNETLQEYAKQSINF